MGPGAGLLGGNVIAHGTPAEVEANPASITGAFLSGREFIPVPKRRKIDRKRVLKIIGATGNNLKDVTATFPLGTFTCVTRRVRRPASPTLVVDTLYKAASRRLMGSGQVPAKHERIEGLDLLDKIIDIDQSPIGRTPRSNPATYTDPVRPDPRLVRRTARKPRPRL